ncbi:MAG: alcohol dehydrogenase catalytic domain-containing protein [Nitrospirae bacterium]|nr:alcohol dehydrogenase catalytic domain-containing protein [Nitrospirota bacterium]
MKVAVYYGKDDIRIEERERPTARGGEIVVRMLASGICGTDIMHWYRKRKAPYVPGHEMAGEVVEIGPDVKCLKVGDRVFVSHHVPCYSCHFCKAGKYTACETLHKGNYWPGGFSEYILVPAENVRYGTIVLDDTVSLEEAVMIEPFACVLEAYKRVEPQSQRNVFIIGSGVSGILHILYLKHHGARVAALDISKERLDYAKRAGADRVFSTDEFSQEALKDVFDGRFPDTVVVCAGAIGAIKTAMETVERRGTVLMFAVSKEDIPIPSVHFWRNEISILFSYGASPQALNEAYELIKSKKVDLGWMVTDSFPLSEIAEAFKTASLGGRHLKVICRS